MVQQAPGTYFQSICSGVSKMSNLCAKYYYTLAKVLLVLRPKVYSNANVGLAES
jgi:hypothetical protein